jgi:hypothetical protein
MIEKGFVDSLIKTIQRAKLNFIYRPADGYTLGIPDIFGTVREGDRSLFLAIEAKQIKPLMDDPFHKGRRTGKMLKHAFSGPQISTLRKLKKVGWEAFGLVRVSRDTAFRIEPEDIPVKTGNFTYEELVEFGRPVHRESGVWRFWRNENDSYIFGARHRDDSGDGDPGDVGRGVQGKGEGSS